MLINFSRQIAMIVDCPGNLCCRTVRGHRRTKDVTEPVAIHMSYIIFMLELLMTVCKEYITLRIGYYRPHGSNVVPLVRFTPCPIDASGTKIMIGLLAKPQQSCKCCCLISVLYTEHALTK